MGGVYCVLPLTQRSPKPLVGHGPAGGEQQHSAFYRRSVIKANFHILQTRRRAGISQDRA